MNITKIFDRKIDKSNLTDNVINCLIKLYSFTENVEKVNLNKVKSVVDSLNSENNVNYIKSHLNSGLEKIGDHKEYYSFLEKIISFDDSKFSLCNNLSEIGVKEEGYSKYITSLNKFLNSYSILFVSAKYLKENVEKYMQEHNIQ